jgi:outer membrane lipoprotein-sorting protein
MRQLGNAAMTRHTAMPRSTRRTAARRPWAITLCAAFLTAIVCAAAARAAETPDPLDDLFARAKAAQAGIHTLAASFTETTESTLLRAPIVATGTLITELPLRVVMTYTSPVPKTIALDEKHLVIVVPSQHERQEIDISRTQRLVQQYFADASPARLRQTFRITLSTDPAYHNAYRLDMVPRRKQINEGLDRLRIWIDRTELLMLRMQMTYPSGDSKVLEFSDVRKNVPIPPGTFAVLSDVRP